MNKQILRARNLHRSYQMGRVEVKVLRGASLQVAPGEFVAVMGASGSGKSTLLHLLSVLDLPDRGTVEFQGRDLMQMDDRARRVYRNREVGFIFQFYHLLPECNVLENTLMPRMVSHSFSRWLAVRRQARREGEELLERIGLSERIKHRPAELSGGERQRVAIARALVNRPSLLLADEPTGNLDTAIGEDILRLLKEFNISGQTIVMVTHDARVASYAHRCVRLSEGVIREGGPPNGRGSPARPAKREMVP